MKHNRGQKKSLPFFFNTKFQTLRRGTEWNEKKVQKPVVKAMLGQIQRKRKTFAK